MIKVRKPSTQEIIDAKLWGTWSKEPSKFEWQYNEQEYCYILEGDAVVRDKDGNSFPFKAGDFVIFEKGFECEWEILSTIKKKYKFQ